MLDLPFELHQNGLRISTPFGLYFTENDKAPLRFHIRMKCDQQAVALWLLSHSYGLLHPLVTAFLEVCISFPSEKIRVRFPYHALF
jgi:hypothetical protein